MNQPDPKYPKIRAARTITSLEIRSAFDQVQGPMNDTLKIFGHEIIVFLFRSNECGHFGQPMRGPQQFTAIKATLVYGYMQLLVEHLDETRFWIPINEIELIKVYE